MLNALKKKQRPGLDWLQPFSHVALLPGLARWLLRKAELRPRTHVPVPRRRGWLSAAPERGHRLCLAQAPPVAPGHLSLQKATQLILLLAKWKQTSHFLSYCLTLKYIIPGVKVSIFWRKKNSSWFFPLALETPVPCNNLVMRRLRWCQSHFFLTAGGRVAPATWFLCLHGVKHLHGRQLPCHPDPGTGRDVATVLPGSPRGPNSFRESRKPPRSTFCAPSSNGILISEWFAMRNLDKCTHHDFSGLLPLILILLVSNIMHLIIIKL